MSQPVGYDRSRPTDLESSSHLRCTTLLIPRSGAAESRRRDGFTPLRCTTSLIRRFHAARTSHGKGVEASRGSRQARAVGQIRELNDVLARQHGAFSRGQAQRFGFDKDAVRRRLANHTWRRIDESVYALAASPQTWEQLLWAAFLSRPRAALTHDTAGRLLGFSGFGQGRPVLLTPRASNARSPIARILESDQFDAIATTKVDGLTVTTAPETILILARDVPSQRIEEVFDEGLISRKIDLQAMSRIVDREAGRRTPGTPLLRRLLSSRRPGAPSHSAGYLEGLLEHILADPRLPPYTREYPFSLDGFPARVDIYVPCARLVIEADGRNWHAKQLDFERDRRRDNALAARGIQVLRFTYEMLTIEPSICLAQTLATIEVRAA